MYNKRVKYLHCKLMANRKQRVHKWPLDIDVGFVVTIDLASKENEWFIKYSFACRFIKEFRKFSHSQNNVSVIA